MEEKSTRPLRNEQFWLLTGSILLIAFIALSFAMYFTRSFMIPFVFSIFLCAMVSPVDNLIVNRWNMPRWCGFAACIMTILFLFICVFFVGKYAIGSINKAIQTVNIKIPESEKVEFNNLDPFNPGRGSIADVTVGDMTAQTKTEPVVEEAAPEPETSAEAGEGESSGEEAAVAPEASPDAVEGESSGEEAAPAPEASPDAGEGESSGEEAAPASETSSDVTETVAAAEVAPTASEPSGNGAVAASGGENAGADLEQGAQKTEEAGNEGTEKPKTQKSPSQDLEETIDYWLQKAGVNSEYLNAKVCISSVYAYIPAILRGSISTLQTFFSFSVLVLLFSVFILMGRNPLVKIQNEIYNEVESSIQKYLNIKLFISLITGISIYIVFLCLGAPMAFTFGVLAFVLNFIPSIGSIIATILPIPILMLTMDISRTGLFFAFFLPCLIQMFFGNFLDPKLQGEGLRLHPVTILLALGYFGVIWGIFGMLLAAPMTAAVRVFLLEFQMTEWIAQLMGGEIPSMEKVLEMSKIKNEG